MGSAAIVTVSNASSIAMLLACDPEPGVGGGRDDQWRPAYKSQYATILKSTGNYHQGEVEEWVLKVSEVPESSALILKGRRCWGGAHLPRASNLNRLPG